MDLFIFAPKCTARKKNVHMLMKFVSDLAKVPIWRRKVHHVDCVDLEQTRQWIDRRTSALHGLSEELSAHWETMDN